MSTGKMRVAILAHSFSAAFRVFSEIEQLDGIDLSIVLTPSPRRSTATSLAANLIRVFAESFRKFSAGPIWLMASGKLVLLTRPLDDRSSIDRLKALNFDVGLHKSGVIYRKETIGSFRLGILNPHIGILPEYRGRSVMEWSLLKGDPAGITVFFIDEGIDTGQRIVVSEEVDVSRCASVNEAKDYLFNLDAPYFRKALESLKRGNSFQLNDGSGQRYYVMSELFRGVVDQILKDHLN